jgi:FkbM family methyltransferase
MITISEHTIEESIIDPKGWILDLGCVNFTFAMEAKRYCENVICVDPNPEITEVPEGIIYERFAVTHEEGIFEKNFYIYNDVQGYSLLNPDKDWCQLIRIDRVPVTTIKEIMKRHGIEKFELIKFDIEGAEYEILKNMDWSISKQFSIEFHDFRFMNPFYPDNQKYYDGLLEMISDKFEIAQHQITDHPGFPQGMGANYWDSLFVQKEYLVR